MDNLIKIRGARQHNLKNINLDIPKNKLVVFTGVSGSGKSSLAFDTIYAEGQRRYVESLSTYARQFLGLMDKPDVDLIEGLSPAISIDQKTTSRNPRSTVGTVTEIYDYLRLLFARIGHPHCPVCGHEITTQSVDQIVERQIELIDEKLKEEEIAKFLILSPVVSDKKGEFTNLFDNLKAKGFNKIRVDDVVKDLSEDFVLIKTNKHTIEVVVDRVSVGKKNMKDKIFRENLKSRLSDSVEQALKLSEGLVVLSFILDKGFELPEYPKVFENHLFSEKFACPVDNIQIPEIEPRTFSFNSPHGACEECAGVGKILKVVPQLVFSDEISVSEGGILPFGNMFQNDTWYARLILKVCEEHGIDAKKPIKLLNQKEKEIILNGTGSREYEVEGTNRYGRMTRIWETFDGVVNELEKKHFSTDSDWVRSEMEKYMREKTCDVCGGSRLKKEALAITVNGISIHDLTKKDITAAVSWMKDLKKDSVLTEREKEISKLIVNETKQRLAFLESVGLEYLTLDRTASTLSGGEAQRIRLASQIGSGLTGVLYVLDEPTIGLHQKDNDKLIKTLKNLRDLGNTVIVVEHDEAMAKSSDILIDFGPGAGKKGGEVVVAGSLKDVIKNKKSLTGKYLSGKKRVELPSNIKEGIKKRESGDSKIQLKGASQFNLKNINVDFPLNKLVTITGVSGSGKSTLLVETLYPAMKSVLNRHSKDVAGSFKEILGWENVDKVILIDQSPIGRTPRSNPATYTKVFDLVRDIYARTREAKAAGYKKGRFSFNVKGGRCEACEGQGQIKIEMQFMSDIWVKCDVCNGKRYNSQTLEIEYKGKNIADVLDMTIEEAYEFFHVNAKVHRKLETLRAVGLDYMELGQPATTLSGGEAQRVKLASELAKRATGQTVYILDEPTTGLHFADVQKLLNVLRLLVDKGNSVFIIEHNMNVIKNSDWIIDLGPEGGDNGGRLIASGRVKDIKRSKKSYTGEYLRKV
jgi:excinuclease ABC subunit A